MAPNGGGVGADGGVGAPNRGMWGTQRGVVGHPTGGCGAPNGGRRGPNGWCGGHPTGGCGAPNGGRRGPNGGLEGTQRGDVGHPIGVVGGPTAGVGVAVEMMSVPLRNYPLPPGTRARLPASPGGRSQACTSASWGAASGAWPWPSRCGSAASAAPSSRRTSASTAAARGTG